MDPRRLLIATIGENDPISPHGPMAALRAAIHDRPELVILVHTNVTRSQADETRRHIEQALPAATVGLIPLPTDDPTDAEGMFGFLHSRWVELRRQLAPSLDQPLRSEDVQVVVCGTSGTRQMGLALTLSADLAFPWARHWTAIHPDAAPAAPTPPSRDPCLRPFHPGVLRHQHETREGFRLLAACRFHEAAARFEERLRLVPLAGIADDTAADPTPIQVALTVARTLRDIGDSDMSAALRPLFTVPFPSSRAAQAGAATAIIEWLSSLESWFAPIQRAIHTPNDLGDPWPAELVAVALREHTAGRLPLAVTRLQTAFEVTMQVRLSQLTGRPSTHGRDTWDQTLDRLRRLDPSLDHELGVPSSRVGKASRLARARNDLVHRGRTQHDLHRVLVEGHGFVDRLLATFGWCTSADAPTRPAEIARSAVLLADWAGLPTDA